MSKENDLKQISLPQIYCEDILGLEMKNSDISFRFKDEKNIPHEIKLETIYHLEYTEEEYIKEVFPFGLFEIKNSAKISEMISRSTLSINNVFGEEYNRIKHYVLSVSEDGSYHFICKGVTF